MAREPFDPVEAARLEVEWWRVHRELQHDYGDPAPLVDALAALYAYVYGVPASDVRLAAEQRALAMRDSDRWVEQGCDPASPLIASERAALVAHTPHCSRPCTARWRPPGRAAVAAEGRGRWSA